MIFLFDMDGTLCDSGRGIKNGIEVALSMMGVEVPTGKALDDFIGPPLEESFIEKIGMNPVEARTTLKWFRDYYMRKGKFENELYPHMVEVLEAAKKKGRVGIATSKPEIMAKEILRHFNIESYFDLVCGASFDGIRSKKEDVLAYALGQIKNWEEEKIYMIGDRYTDIQGAKNFRLSSIGVLYGYGSEKELTDSGSDYLVRDPRELKVLIESL